jgi:hypothetical protein
MKRFPALAVLVLLVLLALFGARAAASPQATLVTPTAVKILVNKDGWHRVPTNTLVGLGVDPSNANAHLSTGGQDVAYKVAGGNFEFYGQALDTVYTDTRVYWLSVGTTAGPRVQTVNATGATSPPPSGTYQATLVAKDRNSFYQNVINGPGNNFFGNTPITPTQPASKSLTLSNVDTTQGGTLRVDLQGYLGGFHTINVALNGNPLGPPVTGSGQNAMTATFNVPQNMLVAGVNTVAFTNSSAAGDAVLTDTYTLTYQHFFMADNDALDFIPPNQSFRVGGFSTTARVVDISNPLNPTELTVSQSGNTLGISPPANSTRMYAFTDAKVLAPKQVLLDSPSDLKATTNKADFIVIAYRDFINPIQPLVNLRMQQGLDVDVVDIEDVYDEFAFGTHTPEAIRDFLQYAKNSWTNPKPVYVLFVGDASVDPRSHLGIASWADKDFIPTVFVTAGFTPEPPSDDSLADFNGDGRPELAVGRLPVESAGQTTAMATKIINYASQAHAKTALLAADNFDRNDYQFDQFSDDLANTSLTPNGVAITKVYRPDGATTTTDTTAHNQIVAAANTGPTIVNWFGHGAETNWAGNPALLSTTDAANLTNAGALSLYLMMTCKNAYFIYPGFNSLAEALLRGTPNGAVAVWASTGDTVPQDQITAAKVATQELFSNPAKRLGDAMLDAKAAVNDIDVLHTWTLLGDPTTRLRFAGPTGVSLKAFTAAPVPRGVALRWRTASEADVAGFNVYRFAGTKKVKVNRSLVVAKRSGTARGASYRLVDNRVRRSGSYVYKLQAVSLSGQRSWIATIRARAS